MFEQGEEEAYDLKMKMTIATARKTQIFRRTGFGIFKSWGME